MDELTEEMRLLHEVANAANTLFTVLSSKELQAALDEACARGDWLDLGDALRAAGYEPKVIGTSQG